MTDKPSAADIRKRVKALQAVSGETDPAAVLIRLANHQAVVRMLAQAQPDLEEETARRMLAEMASLLHALKAWTAPAETADDTAAAPEADGAQPECDNPDILASFDKVKVFIDGACKGNPGPAAVGIAITDVEGNTLYEEGRRIGETTNNVAEYHALIRALEILTDKGRSPRAWFFSDSQLLVNQVNGEWQIKHPSIKPLIAQAMRLRRQLAGFQIVHVPREQNRRADELANLAYKRKNN